MSNEIVVWYVIHRDLLQWLFILIVGIISFTSLAMCIRFENKLNKKEKKNEPTETPLKAGVSRRGERDG